MNKENVSVRSSVENVPASTTQSTITLTVKENTTDEYNPFKHRNVTHPTSTSGAFFHLLKSALGSGLLAMPAAFRNAGLIPGCIGTVVVAFIATHCVHVLIGLIAIIISQQLHITPSRPKVATSREVCKETRVPLLNYTDTCEGVFKIGPKKLRQYSKHIRHFVDAAMAGVCGGGTSVYVLFIASALKDLFDHFAPDHKYDVKVYCAILLLPLILIAQIRHLKFLVPFSFLANICLLVTFGVTCYYTFTDIPPRDNIVMVGSIERWPLFLSTAIFAMEGINVVMPVENEMAKPKHFLGCPSVLNVTMVFVAVLYGVTGVFGYLKYGDAVLGSVTLNLPEDEILSLTAKVLVAVAVFFTYGLQMYAPLDIVWSRMKTHISKDYHNVSEIAMRTISVTITVILAVAVPDLELLIGLVGAIFFSTLGLLIPIVIQTVHRWERGLGKFYFIIWKNILLVIFYFIVLLSGFYAVLSQMIAKWS